MPTTQISAHVSEETKARLDRYVRQAGVTRARVIEEALMHHLEVLEELPRDVVVPARLILTQESAKRVRDLVTRPSEPTADMQRLFDDR